MNLKELITLSDIYAPSAYADMVETEWGVMFFDENSPTKHDSNHASILNDNLFNDAIEEIKQFYIAKSIQPRIFLLNHQKEKHEKVLTDKGFNIYNDGDFEHFLLLNENRIPYTNKLNIHELTDSAEITDRLLHNLYDSYLDEDPDELDRMAGVLPRCVESRKCRVFVGYLEDEPVCLAMIVDSGCGMLCFDLVETAVAYQGNGYASELISYLVQLCDKPTFLYSDNPIAIHIYEKAGFEKIDVQEKAVYWRAVYDLK